MNNLYRQLQEFATLQDLLKPRFPLPAMRRWAISPDFGVLLLSQLMRLRPKVVVELGTGVSTLITGYYLQQVGGGRLIGFDHEAEFLEKTKQSVIDHGLTDYVELHHAPITPQTLKGSVWHWYDMPAGALPEQIDLLVVDGPPGVLQPMARYPALPMLEQHLKPSAVILLDDAARPDEKAIVQRWLNESPRATAEAEDCEKGAVIFRRGG